MNIPEWMWWVWHNCKTELGFVMIAIPVSALLTVGIWVGNKEKASVWEGVCCFIILLIFVFLLLEGIHLAS